MRWLMQRLDGSRRRAYPGLRSTEHDRDDSGRDNKGNPQTLVELFRKEDLVVGVLQARARICTSRMSSRTRIRSSGLRSLFGSALRIANRSKC